VLEELSRRLSRLCSVEIFSDCATVSLVGKGIRTVLHRLGPALEVFGQRRIYQISQAADDLNLSFVVESRHAERLVAQFHRQLIPAGIGGDSVFGPTFEQLFGSERAPEQHKPWWQTRRRELVELMAGRDCAYVYDLPTVRAAARRLAALDAVDRVFYSMKANPHTDVLQAALEAGFGIGCASLAEADRARALAPGLAPADILLTPSFAPRAEYRQAIAMGLTVTVDSLHILEHWGEDLSGAAIFLRIDPDSAPGYHRIARTAGSNAKFGIPANDLERAIDLCAAHGICIRGLHAHTGSGIMQPANWHRSLEILGAAAARIATVEVINLGGGLGVPARADELPLDLAALDAGLARLRRGLPRPVALWIEPGRYLAAAAGVLLARVTQIKDKGARRYVGVATGMNSLIRPALYGAWHEIVNLSRAGEPGHQVCDIVGPISESADVFGLDRLLPTTHEGDILLIANTGAYGAAMASRYNLREPAAEFVLE
ncbi:MAG TPA: alanine racemase, partial [Wenzhouxiangella sp.]|nr:alanine racemase [Wenzhouxiangella sp.]